MHGRQRAGLIQQVVTIINAANQEKRVIDGRLVELTQARFVRVVGDTLEIQIARLREHSAADRT